MQGDFPKSRMAMLEQQGLSLEQEICGWGTSYKLLATLQTLCIPEAQLSAHTDWLQRCTVDIRSRLTLATLHEAARALLTQAVEVVLGSYTAAETAGPHTTSDTDTIDNYLLSQRLFLHHKLAALA